MLDVDGIINTEMRKRNRTEKKEHKRSGKLSASKLYDPLLEQCLYILGVPTKENDDYSLRLFSRGNEVENWVVDKLPEGNTQKVAEYRDCVGLIDYIDSDDDIYEIKSLKASQFKWIMKSGAKEGHKWQACLYALSEGSSTFTVLYAVADDYRITTHTYATKDYKLAVDSSINAVERTLASGVLPKWEARAKWQENPMYSKYPEWISLTDEGVMIKLEKEFPDQYEKLQDWNMT